MSFRHRRARSWIALLIRSYFAQSSRRNTAIHRKKPASFSSSNHHPTGLGILVTDHPSVAVADQIRPALTIYQCPLSDDYPSRNPSMLDS